MKVPLEIAQSLPQTPEEYRKAYECDFEDRRPIAVIGGYVRGRSDGDRHYVGPYEICRRLHIDPSKVTILSDDRYHTEKLAGVDLREFQVFDASSTSRFEN